MNKKVFVKKVFVLDTNVLLHDPEAPSNFGSDRIVLPIQVIEEIDRFKRDPSEKGRNSRRVARLLVTRPPISHGKEIGFLPGTLDEKLAPWMQPIVDNLDFLTGDAMSNEQKDDRRRHGGGPKSSWSDLREMGLLEVEAINYIRGRSIPHQFMVVDEAQNLTPHEVKTIVTRVGEGTKIVFTGDPYQIDNPYVDAESNGLTWLAERLKGQTLVGHMTLTRGERSALAELAANML